MVEVKVEAEVEVEVKVGGIFEDLAKTPIPEPIYDRSPNTAFPCCRTLVLSTS